MKERTPWRMRTDRIPRKPPKTPQETAVEDFKKGTKLELQIGDIEEPQSPSTRKDKDAAQTGQTSAGTDGATDTDSCSALFACPGRPSPASAAALGDYYRDLPPVRSRPEIHSLPSCDESERGSLSDQPQEERGEGTELEVRCLLSHPFPDAAFSVKEEEAIRSHFQRYWEEERMEDAANNKEWIRDSFECLREYRQQLKSLLKCLQLALGAGEKPCSPEAIVRQEAVTVALSLRPQEAVPSRKKRLVRSANEESSRPDPNGIDETSSGRASPPDVVLRYAVLATKELIRGAEKVSENRRPRGRRPSREARQKLVANLLTVRCNQCASGRKPRTRASELVNGLAEGLREIELPCISGPHMQEWGRWALPMDGETLVETREKALREWLLRRILAGDAIREAFLSKEQIALLLVAAGVAAMPPEPLSDHSANEDSDDEPRDPSIGGRDAKDEALDMVAYDVQVLRGTAKNKSARKRWKSPNTIS